MLNALNFLILFLTISVGDKIEGFSDAYSMQSDIYVSGTVRLPNYQYDPLRAPCHFTDLSFASSSSGGVIVLSGTSQLVGMHRASANYGDVPPFIFSQETPADVIFTVMSKIYEAVTDSDANTIRS